MTGVASGKGELNHRFIIFASFLDCISCIYTCLQQINTQAAPMAVNQMESMNYILKGPCQEGEAEERIESFTEIILL